MPANRLRVIRQDRGLTLDQVIDRLPGSGGIDRRMLSKLELGQRALTPERTQALAAALEVDPAELTIVRPSSPARQS